MINWSVNLSMLFMELPFLYRFQAAADAGFSSVEFHWPSNIDIDSLVDAKQASGVEVVLLNIDAGDIQQGDRGFASHPERKSWWRARAETAIRLARRLNAKRINALAGIEVQDYSRETMRDCLCDNLTWAIPKAESLGISLMLEPLNRYEFPGYLITRTSEAIEIIDQLGSSSVQLQFDFYHTQRNEGNLIDLLGTHVKSIGHVQIADSPDRNQPGTGDINWLPVLKELETVGYAGFVGLEYTPIPNTIESLRWLPRSMREQCRADQLTF